MLILRKFWTKHLIQPDKNHKKGLDLETCCEHKKILDCIILVAKKYPSKRRDYKINYTLYCGCELFPCFSLELLSSVEKGCYAIILWICCFARKLVYSFLTLQWKENLYNKISFHFLPVAIYTIPHCVQFWFLSILYDVRLYSY